MIELFDFFLEPYRTASIFNIILEFIAALFGVVSVIYAKKENILVFPTGIISTGIYVYMLAQWSLYGDLIINIYYTLMSIYGWYMWSKVIDANDKHISITRTNLLDKAKAFGIFVFTSIFVIIVYRFYDIMPNELSFKESVIYAHYNLISGNINDFRKATPFLDTFTTGVFFSAMWLMANKKLESWTLWIIGNIVSIPLYFVKGYGFTGVQYLVFLILAIMGYIEWRKQITNKSSEN
ncbi:MAG: nicotinamide mononucleotide transporter [Lentimicrobiaceae bacterium]|jgi:nicotinamide mononucleotide transporter|nr:nicotinamide mononucleotide transporter [Lentimicrobiaceae bacterium]MBT3453682.1 nicotinamide mononucleotide transporter [Lentimicrobiaceae bacterium]MBT3818233.1 nicotinamide mononucleotide transporter [Lentimicrobiaceae bacterium]MBT4061779.1 nicotinamide mononucleotide transporter [Lentimicrobiaceae bacterium]MBT4190957.1 nicotinamide mononucleotide transporter [Lentimicrobiaceae bacterium]